MKLKLVFEDWQDDKGDSIYNTDTGVSLAAGQFHSGTTFDAEIDLSDEDTKELWLAMVAGCRPVFWAALSDDDYAECERMLIRDDDRVRYFINAKDSDGHEVDTDRLVNCAWIYNLSRDIWKCVNDLEEME